MHLCQGRPTALLFFEACSTRPGPGPDGAGNSMSTISARPSQSSVKTPRGRTCRRCAAVHCGVTVAWCTTQYTCARTNAPPPNTHTCTHARTHARAHTHTHTHTHAHTLPLHTTPTPGTYVPTCTHAPTHVLLNGAGGLTDWTVWRWDGIVSACWRGNCRFTCASPHAGRQRQGESIPK